MVLKQLTPFGVVENGPSKLTEKETAMQSDNNGGNDSHSKRSILKWTAGVGSAFAVMGILPNFGISRALAANLGRGDIGVLNYAYALEQLEAAFYSQVLKTPYRNMSDKENDILSDIRDHEVEHRNFLREALGNNAIGNLKVNFAAVNFQDRSSVLTTARTFEDLGVSAYNGAGKLLKKADYLLAAGKIVSVEARHAATIRDLIKPLSSSFAGSDVINNQGLDKARTPAAVLQAAKPFIKTPITMNRL